MGRRPNQLVNNFFERGRKLADSSNRYEQTCKRCGELFPKGRVAVLLKHILQKCTHATQRDREDVDHYLRHPEEHAIVQAYGHVVHGQLPGSENDGLGHVRAFVSPVTETAAVHERCSKTALDTLAEASRHHTERQVHTSTPVDDQTLMGQLRQAAELRELQFNNSHCTTEEMPRSYDAHRMQAPPTVRASHSYMPTPQPGFHEVPEFVIPQTAEPEPKHVEGAKELPNDYSNSESDMVLDHHSELFPTGDSPVQPVVNARGKLFGSRAWEVVESNGMQTDQVPAAPSHEQVRPADTEQATNVSKPRNKYTDERRKEVSDTRRRGACLRCRMLKKPCSDGDPCSACSSIEAARLWQGTCVRTRLADVCTLYSAGLFRGLANARVSATVQTFSQRQACGRIDVRITPLADSCMSFACTQHSELQHDPEQVHDHIDELSSVSRIWLLDKKLMLQAPDKVQEYIRAVADTYIEQEPSSFLKATLRQAQQLIPVEEEALESNMSGARLSYKLHAQLLQDVIELWVETQLLTTSTTSYVELRHDPTGAPQLGPNGWIPISTHSTTHEISALSHNHTIVTNQLLAIIEERASSLSKSIINEMEKRLLQRQQVSRFGTFIAAVLLLNCAERMTGLYRTFDDPHKNFSSQSADWPLDVSPNHLWTQGEQFAGLLTQLLRLRRLPPKTFKASSGMLGVAHDPKHRGSEGEQVSDLTSAYSWLEPLHLQVNDLKSKADGREPGADEEPQHWDLRYISRVLLPEGNDASSRQ